MDSPPTSVVSKFFGLAVMRAPGLPTPPFRCQRMGTDRQTATRPLGPQELSCPDRSPTPFALPCHARPHTACIPSRIRFTPCSTPTAEVRNRLVNSAAFEPLWDPVALAREGALPGEVAAEVEAAAAAGDSEAAKQVRPRKRAVGTMGMRIRNYV